MEKLGQGPSLCWPQDCPEQQPGGGRGVKGVLRPWGFLRVFYFSYFLKSDSRLKSQSGTGASEVFLFLFFCFLLSFFLSLFFLNRRA